MICPYFKCPSVEWWLVDQILTFFARAERIIHPYDTIDHLLQMLNHFRA